MNDEYVIDNALVRVVRRETTHTLLRNPNTGDTRWIANELRRRHGRRGRPMRINRVKHALKKGLSCGKCGKKIVHSHDDKKTKKRVLGDPYIWIKKRYGGKQIRCTATPCGFTSADMTSSDKLSRIYQSFPSGCPKSEECRERADELSSWADEVESADFDELEEDGDKEEWIETQRENALGVVDACPV